MMLQMMDRTIVIVVDAPAATAAATSSSSADARNGMPTRICRPAAAAAAVATSSQRSHKSEGASSSGRRKHNGASAAAAAAATATRFAAQDRTKRLREARKIDAQRGGRRLMPLLMLLLLVQCCGLAALANCQLTTAAASGEAEISSSSSGLPASTEPSSPAAEITLDAGNHLTGASSASSGVGVGPQTDQPKPKPVNFTLVDEIFESALGEDELLARWKRMDSQIQEGMKSILKMIFPAIVSVSQDAKVSGDCSGGILKWILSLRNLRSWAIKMLDATGKPTAGVLEGSLTMMGNYRQCLSVRAPDEDEIEITEQFEEYFRGQFCVLHLKPWMPAKPAFYQLNSTIEALQRKGYKYYEKSLYDELAEIAIAFNFVDIRMDLCVPSTCTLADIQRVAELLSKTLEMRAKVMRCDTAPRASSAPQEPTTTTTTTTGAGLSELYQRLDRTSLVWLAAPLLLVAVWLVSSLLAALGFGLSFAGRRRHRRHSSAYRAEAAAASAAGIEHSPPPPPPPIDGHRRRRQEGRKLFALVEGLSIASGHPKQQPQQQQPACESTNCAAGDHLAPSDDREQQRQRRADLVPKSLLGLRSVFVIWFIIVQMTVELKYQYLRESLNLRNMIISYWPFQIIINSTLLFEALIVITAFVHGYANLECTLSSLIGRLTGRYLSQALAVVSIIGATIVMPQLAIESAVWRNFVDDQAQVCKSNGHIDLFFLQNFIPYDKICLPHSWLICVEMQLLVLVLPLMLALRRNFRSLEDSLSSEMVDFMEPPASQLQQQLKAGGLQNQQQQPAGKQQPAHRNLLATILLKLLRSKSGLFSVLLILVGWGANFAIVYSNQLPPSWFYSFPDPEQKSYYFGKYLTKTWTHLSSFLIGLLAGHVCRSHLQLRSNRLVTTTTTTICNNTQFMQESSINGGSSSGGGGGGTTTTAPTASSSSLNNFQDSPQLSTISRQSHGSTSTIMAMEMTRASGLPDESPRCLSGRNNHSSSSTSSSCRPPGATAIAGIKSTLIQLGLLSSMLSIIMSTFSWSTQAGPSPLVAALYDSSSRVAWSLALSGIMFILCITDRQAGSSGDFYRSSMINSVLGHPICTRLGGLSQMAYLVAPLVNTFVLAAEETSLFPSIFMMFHVILGNVAIIYIFALILATVIEQPVRKCLANCNIAS